MTNSAYCFIHNPAKSKERAAARRAGGVERSRRAAVLPPDTPDFRLGSSSDVVALLELMTNMTLRGQLDPKVSREVGYLLSVRAKTWR
jgi:hypothetical protein